jgi:V/A-type H+/Na+-transporting ATPase subunit I
MIVAMSRVTVVGPRRLQAGVAEAVQTLGTMHIDQVRPSESSITIRPLADRDQAAREAVDAVRTRAEAVLALLPPIEVPPIATAPYENQAPEALRARLDDVDAQAKDLTRRLLEVEEEQEILQAYGRAIEILAPLLAPLEGSRMLEAAGFLLENKPGALDALRTELTAATQGRVELLSRPLDAHRLAVVAAFARRDAESVRPVLTRAGATELRLPASVRGMPLAQAVGHLQGRARVVPGEIERLREALIELSRRRRAEVAAIAVVTRDAVHRYELMAQMPRSQYAFVLYAWVPTARVPAVREGLRSRFHDDIMVFDEPAPVHHAERVPVLLDNPAWLKPFELFLGIFDPPKYGTFDPTIFFALTMPLWVGLIIGDVGYGLFLLAITYGIYRKMKAGKPWRVILAGMDFGFTLTPPVMRRVVALLSWMTGFTFLFGLVFGEFFGDLPQRVFHGFHPVFDRLESITTYFYLSVGFGLAQVYLGLVLEMMKAVRHRERKEFLEAVAMLTGSLTVFVWLGTQVHILPRSFFSPVMAVAAVLFLLSILASASASSAMWVMESISTFGAIISYARIFAVGVASLALAIVANTIGGRVPALFIGIFVGAVAQILFFGLTIIGHIIQPARLNWVEFFSRFKYYQDTGRAYRPFQRTGGGA